MRKYALAILIAVVLGNLTVWAISNRPAPVDEAWGGGAVHGLAYAPYRADQDASAGETPKIATLEADLALLSDVTSGVRTYSTEGNMALIPAMAERQGLTVTKGAWLNGDWRNDETEIARLIDVARSSTSINALMVGNEALLRGDLDVGEMIAYLDRVRAVSDTPVSTAEPWHVWLEYPELANHVDFLTVHLLPYWESIPLGESLDYVFMRYEELRERFPDREIVVGEVGWPSQGQWRGGAEPSLVNQANFVRGFLNEARSRDIPYFLMEAIDQPWKWSIEGTVGTSWGLFDANRNLKFPMDGGVTEFTNWPQLAILATVLAAVPIIIFLTRQTALSPTGQLFFAILIQAGVSILVASASAVMGVAHAPMTTIVWPLMIGAQAVLVAFVIMDGFDFAEVFWRRRWARRFQPHEDPVPTDSPMVSIHVPISNEPPRMVIETLEALAHLDYPRFEVIVVDNNTTDDALWRPVQSACQRLGPQFRFFHVSPLDGFKAGALNLALEKTDPGAEIVGVIDSDYIVSPNWLSAMVPHFRDPAIGLVQSPQDYRDRDQSLFKRMMYWEYAGFFKIGMVLRNESNAIIEHGTMTLVRRTALEDVEGWAEWCITEDAELGLKLLKQGWQSAYCAESFGRGLMPDTFADYRAQRFRWSYGAIQILKRHWRAFLPGNRTLATEQKYRFLAGWAPWFADAALIGFAIAAMVWTAAAILLPHLVELPPTAFIIPAVTAFLAKVIGTIAIYRRRVTGRWTDVLGATVAGMALSHTVGRAVWSGLFTSGKPFLITPKCQDKPPLLRGLAMARGEVVMTLGLVAAALAIIATFSTANRDAMWWAAMLGVQAIAYGSAVVSALVNTLPALAGPGRGVTGRRRWPGLKSRPQTR